MRFKRKRHLALKILLIFTLLLSNIIPTFAGGGSGSTDISGGGYNGALLDKEVAEYNTAGYRIYLTTSDLVSENKNNVVDGRVVLGNSSYYLNHDFKEYAIYEIFSTNGQDNYSKLLNNGGTPIRTFTYKDGRPSLVEGIFLGNTNPTFEQLVGPNGGIAKWNYEAGGDQLGSLRDWANSTFSLENANSGFLDTFLNNYRGVVTNTWGSIPDWMSEANLNSSTFEQYVIVVEPVIVHAVPVGGGTAFTAVSYQDYFNGYRDFIRTYTNTRANIILGYNDTIGKMRNFFTDYTSPKYGRILTQDTDEAGFGIYYNDVNPTRSVHALGTVSLYNDNDIKANVTTSANIGYATSVTDYLEDTPDKDTNDAVDYLTRTLLQSGGTISGTSDADSSNLANKYLGINESTLTNSNIQTVDVIDYHNFAKADYSFENILSNYNNANITVSTIASPVGNGNINLGNIYTSRYSINENSDLVSVADGSIVPSGGLSWGTDKFDILDRVDRKNARGTAYDLTRDLLRQSTLNKITKGTNTITRSDGDSFRLSITTYIKNQTYTNRETHINLTPSPTDAENGKVSFDNSIANSITATTPLINYGETKTITDSEINTFRDGDYVYLVAYRGDISQSLSLASGNPQAIADAIKSELNRASSTYNQENRISGDTGISRLRNVISRVLGVDTNEVIVSRVSSGDTISKGATSSADNTIIGYDYLYIHVLPTDYPIQSTMSLRADELNYIYKDLLGETSSSTALFRVNKPVNVSKTPNYSGDIITYNNSLGTKKNIFYYKLVSNFFGIEMDNLKTITAEQVPTNIVSHAVNLTRGNFGDRLTVSSFNPTSSSYNSGDYLTGNLDLRYGNVASPTFSSIGIQQGTTGRITKTLSDTYRWSANIASSFYTLNGDAQNTAWYRVSSIGNKYVTNDKATSENSKAGTVATLVQANRDAYNYKSVGVFGSSATSNFYTEVKMRAYKPFVSDTITNLADVQPIDVFVLGEKARSIKPSSLYIMTMNGYPTSTNGTLLSDTIAVGTKATSLSNSMGNLPVVYAGGNINVKATSTAELQCTGYALDLISLDDDMNINVTGTGDRYTSIIADNSDLRSLWSGWDSYNPVSDFTTWLDSVSSNLAIDVSMEVTRPDGSTQNEYNNFSTALNGIDKLQFTDKDVAYPLNIIDGNLDKGSLGYVNFISSLARNYGVSTGEAEVVFESTDLYQSIIRAIEVSADWYKETTRTFVIREYSSLNPINNTTFALSDKVDITSGPSITGTTADDLFKQGYYSKFYLTLYLKDKLSTTQSSTLYDKTSVGTLQNAINTGTVLLNKVHINGADFIISDATTSDMRR